MSSSQGCTFGWKRKIGEGVVKSTSSKFESSSAAENDVVLSDGEIDWLHLVPNKKKICLSLEDGEAKSSRLTQEAIVLAEAERFWEAITKWDEALLLTQKRESLQKIHDMKAQVFMSLNEIHPAVDSAVKSTKLNILSWEAHQTLGRAYLCTGALQQAVRSFSVALHLNPDNLELWDEDFKWAMQLQQQESGGQEPEAPVNCTDVDCVESDPETLQISEGHATLDNLSEGQPILDNESEGQPTVDNPSESEASVDNPSEGQPTVDNPSESEASVDNPSEGQASVDNPSRGQQSVDNPFEGHSSATNNKVNKCENHAPNMDKIQDDR